MNDLSDEDFCILVNSCCSFAELAKEAGYISGGTASVKSRCIQLGISTAHFASLKEKQKLENPLKRAKLWNISAIDFANHVKESKNWSELMEKCGYSRLAPKNVETFKRRVQIEELDTSHFVRESNVKSDRIDIGRLKKRLYKEGKLEEKCSKCGLGPEYNGKPLVLQLDHIDGDRTNNDADNIRILCPNCHSQTETFNGKNKSTYVNI